MPPSTTLESTNSVARRSRPSYVPTRRAQPVLVVGATAMAVLHSRWAAPTRRRSPRSWSHGLSEPSLRLSWRERAQAPRGPLPGRKDPHGMPNAFGFAATVRAHPVQVQGPDAVTVGRLASQSRQPWPRAGRVGLENTTTICRPSCVPARLDSRGRPGRQCPRRGTALRSALDGSRRTRTIPSERRSSIPIRILSNNAHHEPRHIARLPVNGSRGVVQLGQFATFEQARIRPRSST